MRGLGTDAAAGGAPGLAGLGGAADVPGPVRTLTEASDLASVRRAYDAALAGLEERVAAVAADDPELPYLRTLLVLTRKVELDLRHQVDALAHLYRDLDAMHDFVHELYPAAE